MEGIATAAEAVTAAGLDWDVEARPLWIGEPGSTAAKLVETHRAVARTTDGAVLGVVGRRYEPLKNAAAFAWFDTLVGQGRAAYDAAGQFNGGRSIWLRAKVGTPAEIVPGDAIEQYLLLTTAHDGTGSCRVLLTPWRGLCSNGLSAALKGAENNISVRHTKHAPEALDRAAEVFGLVETQIDVTIEAYKILAHAQLRAARVDAVLREIFPDNPEARDHRRTRRKRELVQSLFDGAGRGLDLPAVKGTAWALFNAITEAVDHHLRGHGEDRDATGEVHAERVLVGSGAALKQRALGVLLRDRPLVPTG